MNIRFTGTNSYSYKNNTAKTQVSKDNIKPAPAFGNLESQNTATGMDRLIMSGISFVNFQSKFKTINALNLIKKKQVVSFKEAKPELINCFKKLPSMKEGQPLIIAHRGFSSVAPENTMAAFVAAYNAGANMIELDVRPAKDGSLIIMHDAAVNRTTDGKGNVIDLNLEELKKLDAGSYFGPEFKDEKVTTLEEVMDKLGDKVLINIEIKLPPNTPCTPFTDKVVELIQKKNLQSSVLVQSFHHDVLRRVNELDKSINLGILHGGGINSTEVVDFAKSINAVTFNPESKPLTQDIIDHLHKEHIMIMPWALGDDDSVNNMQKLQEMGVDGIITNYPDKLVKILL
jgi:glycerophosphoryl diester phosphodiesterase